ncbi:MAG TPA: hypothetical protein VGD62_01770 [Acidobacteriaceae bacterium]
MASLPFAVFTLATLPVGVFVTSLPLAVLVVVFPVFVSWVTLGLVDAVPLDPPLLPDDPVLPVLPPALVLPLLVPELLPLEWLAGAELVFGADGFEAAGAGADFLGAEGPATAARGNKPASRVAATRRL